MAQTQTPSKCHGVGEFVDYTPSSAVYGGDVVLIGSKVCVAPLDIAANVEGSVKWFGEVEVPQKAETIHAGDVVYWDADGDPVTGTAGTGAATETSTAGYVIGRVMETTAATDTYIRVFLSGALQTTTIAGAVTADSITATDASLGVDGIAAAQGGAIALTGGTSSTAGNAGGAITLVGGTPGVTGAGGAITATGGAGGATSGTGGAITIAGGAGTNGNANGGAVTINGGAKNGSGTDGAIVIGSTAASITCGKMPRFPVTALAAGGTAIGNANAVSEGFNIVSGADDTAAVILPAGVAGMSCIVKSTAAGKNLQVFPQVGSTINAGAANAVYNQVADAGVTWFFAQNTTAWFTLPLVTS